VAVQTKCFIFQFCLALTALDTLHHVTSLRQHKDFCKASYREL